MTNDEVLQHTQHLIGTPYAAAVKVSIAELTGRHRILGPGEISTKEYDTDRITVVTDDAGIITAFNFG